MIHVLYLDDEEHNLTAFRAAFRRDFHVHVTTVPSEAVHMLQEFPIEVVISDQKMPDISGVEFFEMIMADHPDPVRMLLTGHADIDAVIDHYDHGAVASSSMDPMMQYNVDYGLGLTAGDRADLLAFLHTLTDAAFLDNPAFSNPH